MKRDIKQFKEWAEKQVKYYSPYLGLNLQDIGVEYDDDVEYLSIGFSYPYLDPTIKFSDKALKAWKDGELKKDRILHELCHALTDPFYAKATNVFVSKNEIEDERERLTDTIAMIIRNLLNNK